MEGLEILAPMFAMFFLTLIVWITMYSRRIPFIRQNNLRLDQLSPIEFARLSPPEISNPSDNLKNLFELPILFYVITLTIFLTNLADLAYVVAMWSFVLLRVFHSAVHCTVNIIMLRFSLHFLSSMMLWLIIGRAAYQLVAR